MRRERETVPTITKRTHVKVWVQGMEWSVEMILIKGVAIKKNQTATATITTTTKARKKNTIWRRALGPD